MIVWEKQRMNKYIITFICGDTYNIPTYDVVECEEKDLVPLLDKDSDYFGWKRSKDIRIFEVTGVSKWELLENHNSLNGSVKHEES